MIKYVIERGGEYYSECEDWSKDKSVADHFDTECEAQHLADELTMSWGMKHRVVEYNLQE